MPACHAGLQRLSPALDQSRPVCQKGSLRRAPLLQTWVSPKLHICVHARMQACSFTWCCSHTLQSAALRVRVARSSRSIFGDRCFCMQALPLEQKPWAYARQTVAEAGSCLCRYLQSFFEHSPCKAAQFWQSSRFLSVLDTNTTVLIVKRVLHDALPDCHSLYLVVRLFSDARHRIPRQRQPRPLTLMTDLQMKVAEWHDIWAGCMLQRAALCCARSTQPLGADSDPCCAMAQTAQALPVAFTSPSPADFAQLTGHPCSGGVSILSCIALRR